MASHRPDSSGALTSSDQQRSVEVAAAATAPPTRQLQPAAFGTTLAWTVTLAFAGFLLVMAVAMLVDHPHPMPCFPGEQNQDTETLLYLIAFAVALPLAVLVGPRLIDQVARGPNRCGLDALTALLAAALAFAIIAVKVATEVSRFDIAQTTLVAIVLWWAVAIPSIWHASRPHPWHALLILERAATAIWFVAGTLTFGVLLCVGHPSSANPVALVVCAALAGGSLVAFERPRLPVAARRWTIAIDSVVVALVLLAVPDLVVVRPELQAGNTAITTEIQIVQFHQNFLLGPANEVLSGGAMLVDTVSQYGVASIYFLVGWFELVPIGYGTFGLLSAACSALAFAAGYGLLRVAGVSWLLAATTLVIAVIALVFNSAYPINAIPQDSTLRFGMPIAVVLPLVAAQRWPRYRAAAWWIAVIFVGISSLWSFEALVYSLVCFAAMLSLATWLGPARNRSRWFAKLALLALAVCVGAHVLFAVLTRLATGHLPDWGQYLAYLQAFLFGELGDLNFDFPPWSPGLAVGAGYLASAAGVALLILRQPQLVRVERTMISALTAATAYGVAIYSYYDNRSTDFILTGVALPAFLAATLWLSLVLRSAEVSRPAKRGALAFALAVATLVVAVGWSSSIERYPHSALAHVLRPGQSMRAAIERLWHMPPLRPAAPAGQRLLERYMPSARRSLLVMTPDLETEVLLRSRRGNVLPLAAPWQDSFIAEQRLPALRDAVDELRSGQRMLLDKPARETFATLRATPSFDPLANRCEPGKPVLIPADLAPLQTWALQRIGERFDLETIATDSSGLAVVELIERR